MVVMEDDSFKKPGAVPFKWEIKPGHPIPHHHNLLESPSLKLRPPPPLGSYKLSPVEPRTRSFRRSSSPKARSEIWRFERPLVAQPEIVASSGCFFSPFLKRLRRRKMVQKRVVEPNYISELETLGRLSFSSTTKSLSPFRPSTVSSSVASSPQLVGDVEWAGFGLF